MGIQDFLDRFLPKKLMNEDLYAVAKKYVWECTREGNCWLCPHTNELGYGIVKVGRATHTLSRVVLCSVTGKPLDYRMDGEDMDACHKTPVVCRSRACCRPSHLYWDTHAHNLARRELERQARILAAQVANGMVWDR